MMDCKTLALEQKEYILSLCRRFPAKPNPEGPSPAEYIAGELRADGIEAEILPDASGCIGTLRGSRPGRTVMLSADADIAFPREMNLPNVCGCHAAMLLGAARILTAHREEIPGTVLFLFRTADRSGTEAPYIPENTGAVFDLRLRPLFPSGRFNLEDGPRTASGDRFTIRIHGQAAHGSAPHQGKDAVLAAAAVVMALQSLVSCANDPQNPFVLTTGVMTGGTRNNIIAEEAELLGMACTFDRKFRKTIPDLIRNAACAAAEVYRCTADLDYVFGPGPVINEHHGLNEIARNAAKDILGSDALISMEPRMEADPFSFCSEHVPGLLGFLGCCNEAKKDTASPHHSTTFDVDEDVLPYGTAITVHFAMDYLNQK